MGQVDLRETACTCIEEITNKRMEIRAKLKLIDYLWTDVIEKCAIALEQQINLSNDEQDNCDYLLKFGKLLNAIGNNLYDGWQKTHKKEPDVGVLLFKCIETKMPYVLQILNHSDDDISESVSEFCMHYISCLKVNKIQTREQQTNIEVGLEISTRIQWIMELIFFCFKNMFNIVVNKTKYDSSFNFDNEVCTLKPA